MIRYFLAIFVVALTSCSTAQHYSSSSKKAIKLLEEGMKIPNTTLDPLTGRPNYREGIVYMDKALAKDPQFWEAHLYAAGFAEELGDYELAIEHYKGAITINPNHSPSGATYFFLGANQQAVGDYAGAIKSMQQYQTYRNASPELLSKASIIIESCDFALHSMETGTVFEPINIGPGINTADPEYFPTITVDGKTILFTRRIEDGRVEGPIPEQEDFYVSQLGDNNIWGKAVPMPDNVNTVLNEGAPTISADGRTLIFVGCPDITGRDYGIGRTGKGSCDLFVTKKLGSRWTNPINLPGNVNSYHWETQPSISSDGKTMYFIRGIRGRNSNDSDIYMARLQEDGTWGTPERLPNTINTPMQEESVLIHPDGRTLYFASRGHVGMGGSDLFMSRMDEDGNWGTPENLGYPINTKFDENSLMVSPDGEIGFFASNREGGFGDLDIYYFVMPEHLRPTKTLYFEGLVFDIDTREPLKGQFQLIDLETGKEIIFSEADPVTGEFMVSLPLNRDYALNVTYPGYAFFSQNFNMKNPEGLEAVHMDVPMVPINTEKPILLANVFFDLNKSTLRKESYVELNKLVDFMNQNPSIKIEIGGHTDSRGHNNDVLSNDRAKAVYDYAVSKGIDASRMKYKGYGSSQPVYTDAYINGLSTDKEKEKAHQANRRTEYKIIK